MPYKLKYCVCVLFIASVTLCFFGCTEREIKIDDISGDIIDDSFSYQLPPEVGEKFPRLTNLPALYITLNNTQLQSVGKDKYVSGKYTVVYDGWEGRYDEAAELRGRGNYSWSLPKKPYVLRTVKKRALLGMDSAKKWILIGGYSDKTLMRNYLTLKLALDVSEDYSPDCRFVDLYINGEYNGNYLITEAIQIHENRIDIAEEDGTEGLFEIEAAYRHNDHTYCIDLPSGVHVMYKEPDGEDISPEIRIANLQNFKIFFNELDKSFGNGYESYSQYIDVGSFVNWYIVNEFVKNYDSGFTTSCYCYIKDGKLHMGPVWDFDTCMGNQDVMTCMNPKGYHVNGSPWYAQLTKDETFSLLLCERWTLLRNEGVFDTMLSRLAEGVAYIAESEKKDHELWSDALKSSSLRGGKSKYTFEAEVEYLTDWILARIEWLDEEWYGK